MSISGPTSVPNSDFSVKRSLFMNCYQELSSLASHKLRQEFNAPTLDTAALVHEAYLKMEQHQNDFQNKEHFMAIAAICMRRFLVDYARQKQRQKRGGNQVHLTFGEVNHKVATTPEQILNLYEALVRLKAINNRYCRVVEYHFFGGYKHEEIAGLLDVSIDTVRRDWRLAKAWLSNELKNSA
ncbi:ECF-type sigma factor [Algoriphagus halophytocola]|uniref:ECF-type sigma factor n=1 Tax=Algoriphagus halophytocola TaxID=2991499 RepID=A0ABY6MK38_9BACT|nr:MULTISPECIES: ECF-type sigma factor [unclassified Algoriphagus]UZD22777.1 ECF-type sigma factor [Algoriphagus sp. TR-M5]WBL44043.1 ECF-type sigma factor [Algoriphagus sp. TR-M9]